MNSKPIGATAHGALDYGFVAGELIATHLCGLKGAARTISYIFIATTAIINAFSKHKLAIKPLIPMRVHGLLEMPFVPTLLLLPLATGVMRENKAKRYFGTLFILALTSYCLTNYNAGNEA